MFSVRQKREMAEKVQALLRETNHPELPTGREIEFRLLVKGRDQWSWADIRNNTAVPSPSVNPHNERMDKQEEIHSHKHDTPRPLELSWFQEYAENPDGRKPLSKAEWRRLAAFLWACRMAWDLK